MKQDFTRAQVLTCHLPCPSAAPLLLHTAQLICMQHAPAHLHHVLCIAVVGGEQEAAAALLHRIQKLLRQRTGIN